MPITIQFIVYPLYDIQLPCPPSMPIQLLCTPSIPFNYIVPPLCHSITMYPIYGIQLPCTPSMPIQLPCTPSMPFNNLKKSARILQTPSFWKWDFHIFTGWTWKRVNGKFWKAALHSALFQSLFKNVCSICQLSHVWHIHIDFSCKYVAVYPDSRDFLRAAKLR